LLTSKSRGELQADTLAKYCLYIAMGNMLVAAGSTIPMLVPELGLPLVVQQWPGTWMFIAYLTLLSAGVGGFVAWGVIYYLAPRVLGKSHVNKILAVIHISVFEGSLMAALTLMGYEAGFVGGSLLHNGTGQFIVTRTIEWAVIPIGGLIAVAIVATLVGILNIVLSPSN
jgi:hypothetical protein